MASETFKQSIDIAAARARVYEELAQPERQLGLNPFLVELNPQAPTRDGDGKPTINYVAYERVRLANIIPYRVTIAGRMTIHEPEHEVEYVSLTWPGVVSSARFRLEDIPGGTKLHEAFTMTGPGFAVRVGLPTAKLAHKTLADNLRSRLEPLPTISAC